MQDNLIPHGFTPARRIRIASNIFLDAKAVFSVDGYYPLLLSDSGGLRCWLSAATGDSLKPWVSLVENNKPRHHAVDVRAFPKSLGVKTQGVTVLSAIASENGIAIIKLDLRPLGLNVFVDGSVLCVGGARLSENTFRGSDVGIALTTAM